MSEKRFLALFNLHFFLSVCLRNLVFIFLELFLSFGLLVFLKSGSSLYSQEIGLFEMSCNFCSVKIPKAKLKKSVKVDEFISRLSLLPDDKGAAFFPSMF